MIYTCIVTSCTNGFCRKISFTFNDKISENLNINIEGPYFLNLEMVDRNYDSTKQWDGSVSSFYFLYNLLYLLRSIVDVNSFTPTHKNSRHCHVSSHCHDNLRITVKCWIFIGRRCKTSLLWMVVPFSHTY